MSAVGERAKAAAAAGVPLHQYFRRPGLYTRDGFAVCGARRDQGAKFTTWAKYVTCADCLRVVRERRAKAKATFAAITGALALLLMVGCGDNQGPDVSGTWAYAWEEPGEATLHGVLTLTQSSGVVTGELGVPAEITEPADWHWYVVGTQQDDRIDFYAPHDIGRPWWFDVQVTGDTMAGPEYIGDDRVPVGRVPVGATFSAVREGAP